MHIPSVDTDSDALSAALAYANAGLYVLPVRRGTKHPGSVVGADWSSAASRDTETLVSWYAGTDHGIALALGRSGLLAVDVDTPSELPLWIQNELADTPYQASDPSQPGRGCYIFEARRQYGNGLGLLPRGWGDIRGSGGVVIVAPSVHKRADEGAEYRWITTGAIRCVPQRLDVMLPEAGVNASAATNAGLRTFIEQHIDATERGTVAVMMRKWDERIANGEGRHETLKQIARWAADEAAAGHVAAGEIFDALTRRLDAERSGDAGYSQQSVLSEARELFKWAIGQVTPESVAQRRERVASLKSVDILAYAQAKQATKQITRRDAIGSWYQQRRAKYEF